jgi:hypothetical protein
MPIKPGKSENEQEFISRCMGEETQTYPQDQSYAICKSKWDRQEMSKIINMSSKVVARIVYDEKYRGINLAGLEKGPNDPCYEDYVQVGTKDMDGREVPNCVPLKEEASKIEMEKGINLAEDGVSYPFDVCVEEQTARYGDEETAKKVCGFIKREYGS